MPDLTLDSLCVNTLRFLAVDAVEKAKSGHPGAPLGAMPMVYVLWDRFLRHNPRDPKWVNRDRFVLSAGHASAMLYALLHATGYDLSLDQLKQFRQWDGGTPGHPEYGMVPGVEATTGPLGQGFGNGVGMAIAERWLAARFNRPDFPIVDHYTYAVVSDGDLMEGVGSEAASLAGTLRLGRLIYLYDSNDVSMDNPNSVAFTENAAARFSAYGWQVVGPVDGNDIEAIDKAIRLAQQEKDRPSLVIVHSVLGYGAPHKGGTPAAHGSPLGQEETKLTKEALGWKEPPFTIPQPALDHLRQAVERGGAWQKEWQDLFAAYARKHPADAQRFQAQVQGELPRGWDRGLSDLFSAEKGGMATRDASSTVLNALVERVPSLIGGSADVASSTKTVLKDKGMFGPEDYSSPNIHFGVREHAMGAIASGIALHGGAIPYAGTFLVFSDYMRPPMRLAAFMGIRVVYVFSHDSIAVGEDGPPHQPVEHVMSLRTVPNLTVIRPADATETAEAWRAALVNVAGPTALIFTRQKLPILDRKTVAPADGARKGAYTLWEANGRPDGIIIATGSEVHLALEAGMRLQREGVHVRVVSMPSWELFEMQPQDYRDSVLPPDVTARVSVEAGVTLGWERYVGARGRSIGVDLFGHSAPGDEVYEKYGFTPEHVVQEVRSVLQGGRSRE